MRCAALGVACTLGAFPADARHAPAASDTLWLKAVAIAGRNLSWVPGLIVTHTEDLDDEGRVKGVQESWVRLHPGDDGVPVSEIVKVIRNGKDETEPARREAAEQRAQAEQATPRTPRPETKRYPGKPAGAGAIDEADDPGAPSVALRFGGSTPFDPSVQDSVSYHRLDRADRPAEGPGIPYAFEQRTPGGMVLRGTAWLAETTGIPLEMRFTTEPPPKHVKTMTARVRFESGANGAWWPAEVSFEALGKVLLFKKRFRSTMTFSDYWRRGLR